MDTMIENFHFFAENKFTRIFGIIGNTSSYAYMPYADNPIQELVSNPGHLPDDWKDLNGFALRTIIQEDVPRTFWYRNERGTKLIGGKYGQTIVQFLKRHNATFEVIPFFSQDLESYFNAILNNSIDISMHAYTAPQNLDYSYPVSIEDFVIMVPINGFLSPHDYFRRPFSGAVWLCIGFTIVFITIAKIMIDKVTTSEFDIWSSFTDIYLALLNLPTEKTIISKYRFYLVLLLFSFIIGNLFGAYFQSFLTVFIKIDQYDTIQDIFDKNISVMIASFQWEVIKNTSYPEDLKKIILPQDFSIYLSHFMSMRNTNFAYLTDADRIKFYIGFQSLFRRSLFRIARETVGTHHCGYSLPDNSPFKEILNDFIIEIRQTGLLQKWDSDVLYQAKAHNFGSTIYKDYVHEEAHSPLTLHQLQFAWNFLLSGLIISSVVFVFECVFEKFLFFLILEIFFEIQSNY
ncbi:uncharacterized protein LOC129912646 [Episyrphus balteatus]|uniref:uncharacterized protein LOC129912646 n=1 Tax=Episyrphus balteatus TaxID=286459 RepID=UPI0024858D08|nr:uncharacterized protein LOC129912646 [Episyrphus balteatus]